MQLGRVLEEFLNVIPEEYMVHRSEPDDFLVEFSTPEIAKRILHSHLPPRSTFSVDLEKMVPPATASLTSLRFRVLVELRGIPTHARSVDTAQVILASACSDLMEAPVHLAGNNMAALFVACWCLHLDIIPKEKLIFIPEPPAPCVECGLFLKPHELNHSKHDGLWYNISINIIEVQDWTVYSDSSDDGTPPNNYDNSKDEDYLGFRQRSRKHPWPRKTRFTDAADGSSGGLALGPG